MRTRAAVAAITITMASLAVGGCSGGADPDASPTVGASSYLDVSLPTAERVDNLLGQMTLDEKIGQMTQIVTYSLSPGDVAAYTLGSVLQGGGTPPTGGSVEAWTAMVEGYQREAVEDTRLHIPILFGVDAVHGFGGMYGATVFPQQIGLGAANDPDLMTRIGHATAEEAAAVGVRWNFGPVLAVPSDVRWGRTYEAYSQDPARVTTLGVAYIEGLQGADLRSPDSMLATPKHFVGDGSTVFGTSTQVIMVPYLLDQGVTPADDALLREVLLPPYMAAFDAGAVSVMPSFSSWGEGKVHGQRGLLTDVLRGQAGFEGFVISDWAGCDQVFASDLERAIAACINAGVDMVMVPEDAAAFQAAMAANVESGAILESRIDQAVSRILTVKFDMGLFENPYADPKLAATIASDDHRALAREAVQKSLVLLSNDGALPLAESITTIAVVGNAADDMGIQAGGWTQTWQGRAGQDEIPGTSIYEGIAARAGSGVTVTLGLPESGTVDVCVAAVGELPYAEGVGDSADLALPGLDVLDALEGRCGQTVLVVISGRPVIITEALGKVNAAVAAWLPGTAGEGIADVLFGDVSFTGTLPMNWPADATQLPSQPGDPALFPIGYGLAY